MVLSASPKIKLSQFDYCKISKKNRGCLCFVFYLQIIRSRLLATWHVIQWANFQTLHFYCPKVAARIFLILISIHCWTGHSSCLESSYREWLVVNDSGEPVSLPAAWGHEPNEGVPALWGIRLPLDPGRLYSSHPGAGWRKLWLSNFL